MAGYYPPTGFHFRASFDKISSQANDSMFQSVSGLNVEMETESFKEGGENRFEHVVPVRTKYSNLVLKRGMLIGSDIISWFKNAFETLEIEPTDVIISLLNEEHQPLMSWNIVNAFPVKWSISDLDAGESKVLVETLELQYQYYTLL